MNKMIGVISGADWSKAPEGATHYKVRPSANVVKWYKKGCYWDAGDTGGWRNSGDWSDKTGKFEFISKEEDLQMCKAVKTINDLEVGMWVKSAIGTRRCVMHIQGEARFVTATPSSLDFDTWGSHDFSKLTHWSYTYNGEYTPIVKETEAEIKIKELKATIKLAQQQIEEYEGLK